MACNNVVFFSEPPEPPPKTFVIKDKFEYFKPCVQVDMDNPDKQDTVTEVYVRGIQKHIYYRTTFLGTKMQ